MLAEHDEMSMPSGEQVLDIRLDALFCVITESNPRLLLCPQALILIREGQVNLVKASSRSGSAGLLAVSVPPSGTARTARAKGFHPLHSSIRNSESALAGKSIFRVVGGLIYKLNKTRALAFY